MIRVLKFFLIYFCIGISILASAQQPSVNDSIIVRLQPEYDQVSSWHKMWFGSSNRALWAVPIKIRVLHLQTEGNGLEVVKKGGGMQTKSLRLRDASNEEWVLRSLQKYPERKLADNLRETVVKDILQDQVSAINPFGSLTVPNFAEALGIPHNVPDIVYVGDDPGLKEYKAEFANSAYLFERYAPSNEKNNSTLKVQEKVKEDNDVSVNQRLVLRARLLDMIIGDWDRHEDQWRWETEDKKGKKIYTPIPRDRDQVYYKTSGIFPWIISHQWLKSRFQPYAKELRDVKGWNYGAKDFDRYFLNSLDKEDWNNEIRNVQKKLTDTLIINTIKGLPDTVYKLCGLEITNNIIARKNSLNQYALEYYDFIAKTVEIPSSDKREQFNIEVDRNGNVGVTVNNIKKSNEIGRVLYHRKFEYSVTKEIRLYGFGGKDQFSVSGDTKSKIKIRLVGGDEFDSFFINAAKNKNKIYVYDRSDEPNKVPESSNIKLRLSHDSTVNEYNARGFKYDRSGPVFRVNYNIDQGIQLGAGLMSEKQGFRKSPYGNRQVFWADYSTGRRSFILNYAGDFKKIDGKNDLLINVNSLGPNNLGNFFGIGNETTFNNQPGQEISYYRNRYDYVTSSIELVRDLDAKWKVGLSVSASFYSSNEKNNETRFLDDYNTLFPNQNVFGQNLHVGVGSQLVLDTRNNNSLPNSGIYWRTDLSAQKQLNGVHASFQSIKTEFSYFINAFNADLVVANKLGGGIVFGSPYFYQLMQLGGIRNLRGYHTNRFTGKSSLYYNLDVHLKLFNFNSYILPGSVGIVGFNDIGRIWQPNEPSNKWHYGYGGGLYVSPAELIFLQGAVGFSKEGALPYIQLSVNF